MSGWDKIQYSTKERDRAVSCRRSRYFVPHVNPPGRAAQELRRLRVTEAARPIPGRPARAGRAGQQVPGVRAVRGEVEKRLRGLC